jgi:glyoxylase I family protein
MQLHHVVIPARDVAALAAFYENALGWKEHVRHHDQQGKIRSIWFLLGEVRVMLESCSGTDESLECPGGFIAYRIAPFDRSEWEQRLARVGCRVETRTPYTSYFRDPEGNRFGLSHYPEVVPE